MPPIVSLTTDFGTRDPYVASMKGVILSRCPTAQIVDLSHEIAPQDVFEAALFIAEAVQWFPQGTIHCVVVDPGVGTARLPIAASAGGQRFVCPDNGLLTFVSRRMPVDEVRIILDKRFMLESISATFHGRDIFAPAAACLAAGTTLEEAGKRLATLTLLDVPEPRLAAPGHLLGVVMQVDRFGNAITNIPRSLVDQHKSVSVRFGIETLPGVHETYSDVDVGKPLALFGSSDYLEIAVHRGNASAVYGLHRGTSVEVRY